jgi:protocatechuate 3,4-dioxygenase beta subunit
MYDLILSQQTKQIIMKHTIISFLTGLILIASSTIAFSKVITDPTTSTNDKAVITGKVIDQKTGESLAGALVELKGTDKKVYTDLEGNYSINNIEPGMYSIEINYISYSSKTQILTIEAGSKESVNVEIIPN